MTHKQQIFIREYLTDFNAKQAAIRAGYSPKTAHSIGAENLTKPEIQEALQKAISERNSKLIADREQRQIFWTRIMLDEAENMKYRLRASELLAKSEGDFTQQVKVESKNFTLTDLIMEEAE